MDKMSFPVACKKFFGLLPDQKVGEFVTEIKALTDEDRKDLSMMLSKELGVPVTDVR